MDLATVPEEECKRLAGTQKEVKRKFKVKMVGDKGRNFSFAPLWEELGREEKERIK